MTDKKRTDGEQEPGGNSKNPFAVPERREHHGPHIQNRIVVPEAAVDDEEELVQDHERSVVRLQRGPADRFEAMFLMLLFLAGSLLVLVTQQDIGMCWDEAYYVTAGDQTLDWMRMCLTDDDPPISGERLSLYWDAATSEPRGHPSVTRWLVALGMLWPGMETAPLATMRWPIAACYGLTLVLIYLTARHCFGRVTAWLSIICYFIIPRVFGHAHFAVTETPTVLMTVGVVYAFLRGLERPWWAVASGVLFGVAMATKINALYIPLILFLWSFFFRRRDAVNNIYAFMFIGPVVMVLLWPWLWEDTLHRFSLYLNWNLGHDQPPLWFMGERFASNTRPVPWHYPLTMLALTTPIPVLILAALGVARTFRAPRKHYMGLLLLLAAGVPCAVLMLPSTPAYDGIRLFLPAMPFVAILAGVGGGVIVRVAAFFENPLQRLPRGQVTLLVLVILLIVHGGWLLVRVHPLYLTYFNAFAAGRESAFQNYEMTYWHSALNREALEGINSAVPDGASITPRAMNIDVLRHYQDWGWLKPTIALHEDRPGDFLLLHYRRAFFGREDLMLYPTGIERFPRVLAIPPEGVTLMGLYKTGTEFEAYRQDLLEK